MFRNYFKVSLRGLLKTPVNSFINVFGLAIAIGITVFAYAFARWTYNTDQFHTHRNEVYLVTFFAERDGALQEFGLSPRPLAEVMKQDFTHIDKTCRVEDRNVVVKYEDHVFHERIRFTDPEFLEMFTFPLASGTASSLMDVNSIILSEDMSVKYFGDKDPIGREMLIKFNESTSKAFKVTGIAKAFPDARTIGFDFLVNFANIRTADPEVRAEDWTSFLNATFVQIEDSTQLASIRAGMEKYRIIQNKAVEEDWAIRSFSFEPLATLHRRSSEIRDDISMSSDGKYQSIIFVAIISVFMLALSCFNYINIAIVTAAKRLKEIGVRKTIGATRMVMIVQFLIENLVTTSVALFTGLILGTFVFIPWIESITYHNFEFTWNDPNLWIYLPVILVLTGIASGLYPSLYISRIQVAGILKGSVVFGKRNPITKIFLGVQLVLACILITAGVMFSQNTDFMKKRSWGYDQHHVQYVSVPNATAFENLRTLVEREPDVLSVSGSHHHLGRTHAKTILKFPDHQMEVDELAVDARYLQTMGLSLLEGRSFIENSTADQFNVIVNESFAAARPNPLDATFRIDSIEYSIVGVVKDFHSYSFFRKVNPAIFRLSSPDNVRYLSVKVREGSEQQVAAALKKNWLQLYPETPFDGGYQEDVWGSYYAQLDKHSKVWKGFAFIAVLLAGLGLYGLVMLNVTGRRKEFSVRKILGAGVASIGRNILSQYIILFAIAFLIGAPLSYLLNKMLFDTIYWYHMPITYTGPMAAVVILILVLLLTVSTQILSVAKANPVEGLKEE